MIINECALERLISSIAKYFDTTGAGASGLGTRASIGMFTTIPEALTALGEDETFFGKGCATGELTSLFTDFTIT